MNCTAKITPERAEVWVPTQNGEASLAALSEESGLPLDKCEVYKHILGGGFGRRGGAQDYVRQAVAIAKQIPGVPIKMIWSREEDMTHDFYRPISQCRLAAGLDDERQARRLARARVGPVDQRVPQSGGGEGRQGRPPAAGLLRRSPATRSSATRVPNLLIEYAMRNTHVPVGPWRGVNTNQNGRLHGVLHRRGGARRRRGPARVSPRADAKPSQASRGAECGRRERPDWGKPLPAGVHRGVAQFMGYGSYSAAVAEVSVKRRGQGQGAPHGAGAQLRPRGQSRPDRGAGRRLGRVRPVARRSTASAPSRRAASSENNFHTYEILRLAEMPKVETVIVPTYDFWGGVGEPTICVVSPAVLNAIFAATGKPVRSLPLKHMQMV